MLNRKEYNTNPKSQFFQKIHVKYSRHCFLPATLVVTTNTTFTKKRNGNLNISASDYIQNTLHRK